MLRLSLLALTLAACVDEPTDLELARQDAPSWEPSMTLHEGAHVSDHVDANARHVHSLWIAGSNNNRVAMTIAAHATDGTDVRIAVLGPFLDGHREVLAADGYAARKADAKISFEASEPGEHLVVVGSYDLATAASYDLTASCSNGCGVSRYDAIATPKAGAIVGDDQRTLSLVLGDALVGHETDLDVELWSAPPLHADNRAKLATYTTSGIDVDAAVPASVQPGDDLTFIVRESGGGRVLDTGVTTRFVDAPGAFARLDSIVYGNTLKIAGVVGFFEGIAELRLSSETRELALADATLHADQPGQEGNGWGAFDASFAPSTAPAQGEVLSLGVVNENGDVHRLGCFEYLGGPRPCP